MGDAENVSLRRYFHLDSTVESQVEFAPGHFVIKLECPGYEGGFLPGQFVNLKCDDAPYGKLYRPFSVLRHDEEAKRIAIYYAALGSGTRWLSKRQAGTVLKVLLPLGNSFTVPEDAVRIALVAGGAGIPPLIMLRERLRKARPDLEVVFLMGASAKPALCLPLLKDAEIEAELATEDGSFGHKGLVTDLLARHLDEGGDSGAIDYVATCGPSPMMAAVQALVNSRIPAEASLEERMACGIGACYGCVTTLDEGGGSISRATICRKGPVLPLAKVRFDRKVN